MLYGLPGCLRKVADLLCELRRSLPRVDADYLVIEQVVKMKFNAFTSTAVERQVVKGLHLEAFAELCIQAWDRGGRPVRLIGVGVRFLDTRDEGRAVQLELFT